MESLVINREFWKGKSVFLTGHTGFKGGWIAHWLSELGASVSGYALAPVGEPNFFTETRLRQKLLRSTIGDVRDKIALTKAINDASPDVVFHMAAQPLVGESYKSPVETFEVNILGTVNVLDAVRQFGTAGALVNVTTDKCYQDREWWWSYREDDRLGGHDPYSASKACSELVTAAYRSSFLADNNVGLASARAGNVIGGGDWTAGRLIPDFFRAKSSNEILRIRCPQAVRPWQHVLQPLSGYLLLAEKLFMEGGKFADSWNFGPQESESKSVSWVLNYLCQKSADVTWEVDVSPVFHETHTLKVDSAKAKHLLNWIPHWTTEVALDNTLKWFDAWASGLDMEKLTLDQISSYSNSGRAT